MNQILLSKSKLADFVRFLSARQKVVAPVALGYGQFKFDEVSSLEEMSLHYIPTILPPKKYYMPQHETLLKYDVSKGQEMEAVVEVEELVLFGVHTCDLAGIQCLNMVFSDRPKDLHYLIRKNHFTLIGLECNDYYDSYANCAMLRYHLPKGGYDLFFTELVMGGSYCIPFQDPAGDIGVDDFFWGKLGDEVAYLRTIFDDTVTHKLF